MASHSLAIAKAAFAASLMRPDPTTVLRAEVAEFHSDFDALLRKCSTANIQLCKDWLLKNITHSKTRTVALGKYFIATCGSLVKEPNDVDHRTSESQTPPVRRRQLHVLYLLNDLLHHVEFHAESPAAKITLVESLPSTLLEILQFSSAHSLEAFPTHQAKIKSLLDLWAQQGFFPSTYIQKLRDTAVNAAKAKNDTEEAVKAPNAIQDDYKQAGRDVPYIMPPSHGDASIPFYDLPAGNMMPLIIPNSTAPINPQSMKPLQFSTGPADPQLAVIVEDFLKDVDALDMARSPATEDARHDIDELGQPISRDIVTGEILEREGYYGWSRSFCENMKNGGNIRGFGNNMAHDQSRSRSRSPRKRRQYSSSRSYSSVDRGRSLSRSRSRSAERHRFRHSSPSKSRSPSSDPRTQGARPPVLPRPLQPHGPSPPAPPPFTHGFPLGPGGVPIPPKPAGYTGPWPPPPPPSPVSGLGGVPPPPKPTGYNGPWPPLPPPPSGLGGIPTPPKPAGYNGRWPPPPPPPLGPHSPAPLNLGYQGDPNQTFNGQQTSPSSLGQPQPYGMSTTNQSQSTSYNTSHQQDASKGNGRGGWTR